MSLDEHIKNTLHQYESEVNTDLLWDAIKDDVPKEDKSTRFKGWVIWLLLLGVITIGMSWNDEKGMTSSISSSLHENEENSVLKVSSPYITEEEVTERTSIVNKKQTLEQPLVAKTNSIPTKNTSNYSIIPATTNHKRAKATTMSIAEEGQTTSLNTEKLVYSNKNMQNSSLQELPKRSYKGVAPIRTIQAFLTHQKAENLPLVGVIAPATEMPMPRKREAKVGVLVGYIRSRTLLNSNHKSMNLETLARRNSEHSSSGYHAQVDIMVPVQKRFWFRTGLSLSRLHYRKNISLNKEGVKTWEQYKMLRVKNNISSLNLNALENEITNGENNDIKIYSSDSYHNVLDIPFVLGYEVGNNQWNVLLEAGVYANILHDYKDGITFQNANYTLLNNSKPSYKGYIGMSTYTGASLLWNYDADTSFKLGTQWMFTPFSTTEKSYGIEQRWSNWGIHIGLLQSF